MMTNLNFNLFSRTQTYEFIGNLFHFGAPGNDTMFNLIILFSEIMFIGFAIIYLLFEVFEVIVDEFSSDYKRIPSNFTSEVESFLDIFFLLFPTVVIIYILIPTLGYIYSEDMFPDPNFALSITITGHQWYWSYHYFLLDSNLNLELVLNSNPELEFDAVLLQQESEELRLLNTDNVVFFPTNTRILLQITSEDVIHSWAIPQLGIKVDAVPGRLAAVVLYADVQANWYGQCSELCGAYHAFMPIALTSISPKIFFVLWVLPMENMEVLSMINSIKFYKSISKDWSTCTDIIYDRNKEINNVKIKKKLKIPSMMMPKIIDPTLEDTSFVKSVLESQNFCLQYYEWKKAYDIQRNPWPDWPDMEPADQKPLARRYRIL